jgi:hypothetical protein
MTEEKQYIHNLISKLLDKFPNLGLKYEFKDKSNTHLIQISPDEIFEQPDFRKYHIAMIQEFYSKFSDSCMAIITSDSLVTVENPEINYKPLLQKNRIIDISHNENVFSDYSSFNVHALDESKIDWWSIFIGGQAGHFSGSLEVDNLQTFVSSEPTTYVTTNLTSTNDLYVYPITKYYIEKGLIGKIFSRRGKTELIPQYEDLAKAA